MTIIINFIQQFIVIAVVFGLQFDLTIAPFNLVSSFCGFFYIRRAINSKILFAGHPCLVENTFYTISIFYSIWTENHVESFT